MSFLGKMKLGAILCCLAAPLAAQEAGDMAQARAVVEGCLGDGGGQACVGRAAAACMSGDGRAASVFAARCFAAETAVWEAYVAQAERMAVLEAERLEFCPAEVLARTRGNSIGPEGLDCWMRVAALLALREQ